MTQNNYHSPHSPHSLAHSPGRMPASTRPAAPCIRAGGRVNASALPANRGQEKKPGECEVTPLANVTPVLFQEKRGVVERPVTVTPVADVTPVLSQEMEEKLRRLLAIPGVKLASDLLGGHGND